MGDSRHSLFMSFVADLPLEEHRCCFNVLRKYGKHRECGHQAWTTIEGYEFCSAHGEQVKKALAEYSEVNQ